MGLASESASRTHTDIDELFARRSFAPQAAVAATAAAILLAGPAHALDGKQGLTILNGTGAAPGKYEQFFDPRPVVQVETVGPGAVTKESARILPNKQIGPDACKTISGAPCVDFRTGK